MTDVLDPEAVRECIDCGCSYEPSGGATGPEHGICGKWDCACHATYWMTVPEAQKRAMWGDR